MATSKRDKYITEIQLDAKKSFYKIQPRACIIKPFTAIINSLTYKASVFVKANKKLLGNYKDTRLVNYRIYYYRKKFYDTGPWTAIKTCLGAKANDSCPINLKHIKGRSYKTL